MRPKTFKSGALSFFAADYLPSDGLKKSSHYTHLPTPDVVTGLRYPLDAPHRFRLRDAPELAMCSASQPSSSGLPQRKRTYLPNRIMNRRRATTADRLDQSRFLTRLPFSTSKEIAAHSGKPRNTRLYSMFALADCFSAE